MIIKDKPLHILSAQFIQCAYFYPAGVLGCATRPYGVCTLDHMRRFSDFIKLDSYQVRLSQYLVRSWSIRKVVLSPLFPAWDDPLSEWGVA
jgi:hypothetical protein